MARHPADLTRRGLCRVAPLALAGGLAGCSDLVGTSSPSYDLSYISVQNKSSESRVVNFRLTSGDEVLFEEEQTLSSREEDPENSYLTRTTDNWGEVSGLSYAVAIDDDDWIDLEPSNGEVETESDCVRLDVDIGDEDFLNSHYHQWPCQTATETQG